ncbi:Hypothetical protein R9X50_00610500 [Acrodontium crateriforme]|uniref:TLC domain-containing protein n=1 Tax=Acrodontium crateriforme TaxID=150365 RepID=A0AAQ3M9E8_9PEZI|nr:Hypothetical protein R9X50_00610500 [Acrodontium crateriforme]
MASNDCLPSLSASQMRHPYPSPPQPPLSITDLGVCASPSDLKVAPHKRRKTHPHPEQETLGAMLRRGIVDHQLGLSMNLMLLVSLSYALIPRMRDRTSAFFQLSYASPTLQGQYGQGPRDLYLVASFIILFTAVRAFSLGYALMPLAGYCGIAKKKMRVRFAEQAYMMVYYAIYWCWGLALFIRDTPSDVDSVDSLLISLWTGFPKLTLDASMKLYYISQLAFWIQQIFVIHIEERRKDHLQMLTHHIITVSLLAGSYPYRQWRVGNAVLVCMDLVDFIFPLAKILRYLQLQTACDAAFAVFVITWFITRHLFYGAICWSIYAHVHEVTMNYGIYSIVTGTKISEDGGTNIMHSLFQPISNPQAQTVAFNANIRWWFLGLLLALQCLTIAWFVMICRVVMRVLRGEGADDTRSDGEEEAEEEVEKDDQFQSINERDVDSEHFIEVEASSEDMTYGAPKRTGSMSSTSKMRVSKGISSGLHLNGHKDLLNRIGCLSEEQLARERERREDSASPLGRK